MLMSAMPNKSPRSEGLIGEASTRTTTSSGFGSGVGVLVQCEKGHVLVPSYTSVEAYDRQGHEVKRWSTPEGYDSLKGHQDNWLAAIAAGDSLQLSSRRVQPDYRGLA